MSYKLAVYFSDFFLFFDSMKWQHYQKYANQITQLSKTYLQGLKFTNIWGLFSDFVWCESFLESNSLDILALCEINLDGSNDSSIFVVGGNLPLSGKDSITHMHGLAVYVKGGLPFAHEVSLENSKDSCWYFRLALLFLVSYFFFIYYHCLCLCGLILMLFHLT